MTIDYQIHHEQRLVWAKALGTMTHEEVFAYQREVWSRPDVTGYHELIDMSDVEKVAILSVEGIRQLAALAAEMDSRTPGSKFAIVRLGVGRQLVQAVVAAAQGRFASLRLRTLGPEAAAFYERLGFRPVPRPDCTHTLNLEGIA